MSVINGTSLHKTVRLLSLFLSIEFIIVWLIHLDNASTTTMVKWGACALVCVLLTVLFYQNHRATIRYLVLFLSLYVCYEATLGLLQNLGVARSHHELYRITGSFFNPNPYASFLSIAFGIELSYLIKHKDEYMHLKRLLMTSIILIIIIVPATKCRSAYCAIFAVTALLLFENSTYKRFIKSHIVVILIGVAVVALLMYLWKRPSADWRVFQNKMSIVTLLQNGFWGSGFGHYAGASGGIQMEYFYNKLSMDNGCIDIPSKYIDECRMAGRTLYAFCDPLHIGVEAGILAMLTYILLVVYSLIALYKSRSPLFYGMVALQVTSLFSYSLLIWQIDILFAIMIAASGYQAVTKQMRSATITGVSLTLLSCITLTFNIPLFITIKHDEKEWKANHCFYNQQAYRLFVGYCSEMLSTQKCNGDFMLEYGTALSQIGSLTLSDSILLAGFEINGNPSFQIVLGDNSLARKEYDMAERYYWNAFCCIPDRVFPLQRLAELYQAQSDTVRLHNIQAFVQNYHPRIESELTDMLRKEILDLTEDKIFTE